MITPFFNPDAEKTLLAQAIMDTRATQKAVDSLQPEDFHDPAHGTVFKAIRRMFEEGKQIELVTMFEDLSLHAELQSIGGEAALVELTGYYVTASNCDSYIRIIQDSSTRRQLSRLAKDMQILAGESETADTAIEAAKEKLNGLVTRGKVDDSNSLLYVIGDTLDSIYRRRSGQIKPVYTGIIDIDYVTGGLHQGEYTILAARPSAGKSTLALQIALYVASRHYPVLFVSAEMSREMMGTRILAQESKPNVSMQTMRQPKQINDTQYSLLEDAYRRVAELPMQILTKDIRPSAISRAARDYKAAKNALGLVVVDYLQILPDEGKAENSNVRIAQMSSKFKRMAVELDVPVLILSQLNRESTRRPQPSLADLRDSGSLEQDADNVWFLHRPKGNDEPDVELIIAKQRQGKLHTIDMLFDGDKNMLKTINQGG